MARPSISAKSHFYNFKEFESFVEIDNVVSRFKEFDDKYAICEINHDGKILELKNNPDEQQIKNLLEISEQSLVGKGKDTVMDKTVRNSREIKNAITISPKFAKLLQREVPKLTKKLGIINEIEYVLHKLIIYEKDSFFDTHIDSEHTKNQIATLSVELSTEYEGGEFIVDGCWYSPQSRTGSSEKTNKINEIKINKPREGCVQLTMFFTDAPHKINKIIEGIRISIQFDIIQKDELYKSLSGRKAEIRPGIDKLKDRGVKKIGVPLNHLYFINDKKEEIKKTSLKGKDRLAYELLEDFSDEIKIIGIVEKDDMIYREEMMNIFKMDNAFKELYHKACFVKGDKDKEKYIKSSITFDDYDKIKLHYDEKNNFDMIHSEYLLGVCVFLNTNCNYEYLYEGLSCDPFEDVRLGNSGFSGTVKRNLAIIATLK